MKIMDSGLIAPVETNWNKLLTAAGRPATIPAKMMMEIPFPIPLSVICSPSHIKNMVPVTREITQTQRKNMRIDNQTGLCFQCDCDAPSNKVPYRVY